MKLMLITGAGISTGAGLSTYRGENGRYDAIEKEVGMPVHALLTPKTLKEKPELVWKYWLEFSLALKGAKPSIAHKSIVEIAGLVDQFVEATQNVDGLSRDAGLTDRQLIELHGTYHKHHCTSCKGVHQLALTPDMPIPPRCYRCRPKDFVDYFVAPVVRPSVVMFEELLDEDDLSDAFQYARSGPDLLVISGTTLMFPYLFEIIGLCAVGKAEILYIDPMAGQYNPHFHLLNPDLRVEERMFNIRKAADEVFPKLATFLREQRERTDLNGKLDPKALKAWVEKVREA